MNWDAVGAIGEIVGATAVVVTLIYLAVQVRQSTVATQAATLQNSVGNDMQILTSVGATAEASEALFKYSFSPQGLSTSQLTQGRWLFASTVRHWENLYLQRLSGTVSEEAWRAREPALRALILCPGWEEYTESVLGQFMGGPFMEFAEQVRAG
jgi:hypothetical protein